MIKSNEKIIKQVQIFHVIKLETSCFLITFDKKISTQNWQHMNIYTHFQGVFRSLGLICIQKNMNAAKAIKKLEEY